MEKRDRSLEEQGKKILSLNSSSCPSERPAFECGHLGLQQSQNLIGFVLGIELVDSLSELLHDLLAV